jgi:hypothetical protein
VKHTQERLTIRAEKRHYGDFVRISTCNVSPHDSSAERRQSFFTVRALHRGPPDLEKRRGAVSIVTKGLVLQDEGGAPALAIVGALSAVLNHQAYGLLRTPGLRAGVGRA